MRTAYTARGREGFTLIELLMVLVIFSLAIGLAAPYVSSGLDGFTIKSTAKKTAAVLNHAKVFAMRDRQNYVARFTEKEVVIESSKGKGERKEMPLPEDIKIEARENSVVVFYPGGGSSGGTFEVKGADDAGSYIIQVEPSTGAVRAFPSNKEDNGPARS